jgi:osmotically-inducible protein OsmY
MTPDLNPVALLLMALIAAPPAHATGHQRGATVNTSPADNTNTNSDSPGGQIDGPLRQDQWSTSEDERVTRNIRDAVARQVMDSDPAAIRIATRNGAVTLSGFAHDRSERKQLGDLAKGTPGTRTLTNLLGIRR